MSRLAPSQLPADWELAWDHLLASVSGREPPDSATDSFSDATLELLGLYAPWTQADHTSARPSMVVAQLGQSLDGCVATASGDSYFVTGPQSLLHLHRLRALNDVVLVGAGTVAADNPRLTTRRVRGPQPTRAVLDPWARLDGSAGLFVDGLAPTLWLCDARFAEHAFARTPVPGSTRVLPIDDLIGESGFEPTRVIDALAQLGLNRVFVEGGGVTVSRFLASGSLDRLHLIVAPVLIGAGKPGLSLPPWLTMKDCPRLPASLYRLGNDLLWDLDIRGANPRISTDGSEAAAMR